MLPAMPVRKTISPRSQTWHVLLPVASTRHVLTLFEDSTGITSEARCLFDAGLLPLCSFHVCDH